MDKVLADMEHREQWYGGIILIVGILLFFLNLGMGTVDIMEARNFVTVREMLQSGDWLHPTMNGVMRLEKPPLPTWITALFASVFGLKNIFFLRLPAALMSLWMLFSLNALVKRLTANSLLAMLSAVSLAGMLYVVLMGRRGTWDIYTHSFMLAAILQFVAMLQSVKPLRRGFWGGVFFGAAFLSKGPIAVYTLFLPFLLTYLWYYRPLMGKQKRIPLLIFVIMAAVISASWFALIQLTFGEEAQHVLGKEIQNWKSYNVKPWFYYLKDYPVHSGVWAAILAMGMFTRYTFNKASDKKAFLFFWVWTVLSIILLSIVPEKKIRYLLPTFLPAAFLVASYLYYLVQDFDGLHKRLDTVVFRIHGGIFALVALGLPIAAYLLFYGKSAMGGGILLSLSIASLFCLFLLFKSFGKKAKHFFVVAIVGLLASAVLFVLPYTDSAANKGFKSIIAIQEVAELDELPCYALEETRIELVWLVGRKIKEVQTLEELQPPYLLLTDAAPEKYVQNFELIGHYDNNSKSKGHKHYEQSLSKYVSVVR